MVIKRREIRKLHPEVINLDSDMTGEQGAKIKKLKPGVQMKLKGVLKTPDKFFRENH